MSYLFTFFSQIGSIYLIKLVNQIEVLSKEKQIMILNFFVDNNIKISTNKCGTFINMSLLSKEELDELESYIADFNIIS